MWGLFMGILIFWIFTKAILNIMEIFSRGDEIIAHREFVKNLQDELLNGTKEE